MLQNPCKTLGFMKNMVYKIPPGGGGKPYPASGLKPLMNLKTFKTKQFLDVLKKHTEIGNLKYNLIYVDICQE